MKCYACGNRLGMESFCPNCGADVFVYKRILMTSNKLYNEGLNKARVRDLSGAAELLRQSIRYDKRNIDARNLLGLVYFEMGEAVLAMSEWIISRNFESKKNVADDYIKDLESNPGQLEAISQTIRKYNQSLEYCYQGSLDLAVIQLKKVLSINEKLIKGYQLLALVYLQTEEDDKARRTLLKALKIDSNNTRSLLFLKEANKRIWEKRQAAGNKKRKKDSTIYSYDSGNDMIIQPLYEKEKRGFSSIINIVIGIVTGVAICWFLILPARIENATNLSDAEFKSVSEQLASEQAGHAQDIQDLENITAERDELKSLVNDLTGVSGKMTDKDYLIRAAGQYLLDPNDPQPVMETLENISEEGLGAGSSDFVNLYNALKGTSTPDMIKTYIERAKAAMQASDYDTAIEEYTRAWKLDGTNSDVLMSLAHAYRENDDMEKANELYRQVMESFPESQNAVDAAEYITVE